MITSIASLGSFNLAQVAPAHAVSPVAVAPVLRDRPRNAAPVHTASQVAIAPAAMTALVEAQERLAQDAPIPMRQDTAQKLDHLISRLNDTSIPMAAHADVPFAMRQLLVARQAISQSLIDIQA